MKTIDPHACTTMAEVRAGVDEVDRRIVALIARRFGYMDAAARIKPTRDAVRDEARKAEVKTKVGREAERLGIDQALLARLYEELIEFSIAHEFVMFDNGRG